MQLWRQLPIRYYMFIHVQTHSHDCESTRCGKMVVHRRGVVIFPSSHARSDNGAEAWAAVEVSGRERGPTPAKRRMRSSRRAHFLSAANARRRLRAHVALLSTASPLNLGTFSSGRWAAALDYRPKPPFPSRACIEHWRPPPFARPTPPRDSTARTRPRRRQDPRDPVRSTPSRIHRDTAIHLPPSSQHRQLQA